MKYCLDYETWAYLAGAAARLCRWELASWCASRAVFASVREGRFHDAMEELDRAIVYHVQLHGAVVAALQGRPLERQAELEW